MIFKAYTPCPELQPFVQCYLEADCRYVTASETNTLFPNGLSGIFFNFGIAGKLVIKEEYKTPKVSVFGQIDRHFSIMHVPGFYSLGVMLHPTVLARLFRINMAEFTNKAFDGSLIHSDLTPLHTRIAETAATEQKIARIESYLIKKLGSLLPSATLADHALHLIHHQPQASIDQVAQHLQVSQRYLETQFKKTVGLSPKTYSLIHRFSRIEKQLMQSPSIQWRELTFAYEYYDQNHFIKDFKRFTGLTPSGYLLESLEMGRSYLNVR